MLSNPHKNLHSTRGDFSLVEDQSLPSVFLTNWTLKYHVPIIATTLLWIQVRISLVCLVRRRVDLNKATDMLVA